MKRKWMFPGLAVMLLAGCSGVNETGGKPAGGESTPKASAKKEPVELTVYNSDSHPLERFNAEFGDKIKEKFPHVTLKYLTGNLSQTITSGEQIDLVLTSIGVTNETIIKYGFQYDLSELIKKNNFDLTRLEPTTVAMQKELANGGVYGLPVRTSTYTLFYNRDIFDKFGVPYPKDGMTWDQLYDVAKQLTRVDAGQQYYGFVMSPGHMLSHNQLSLPSVEAKTNKIIFTNDNYKKMLTNFIRFFEIPGMETYKDAMSTNTALHKELFAKKQTAAMFAFSTIWRDDMMKDVNWDVVTMPYFKEAMGVGPQSYPSYFYVTNTSKYKEQAFEISAFLTSDEYQLFQSRNGIPTVLKSPEVNKEFAKGPAYADFYKGKHIEALTPTSYASPVPKSQFSGAAEKNVVNAMKSVIFNKKDLNTALREAEQQTEKDFEALKK